MSAPVSPIVYVVRHTHDLWSLYPFYEDVAERLEEGLMAAGEILRAIRYLDVSLILSHDGGDVLWKHGRDVTISDLHAQYARRR